MYGHIHRTSRSFAGSLTTRYNVSVSACWHAVLSDVRSDRPPAAATSTSGSPLREVAPWLCVECRIRARGVRHSLPTLSGLGQVGRRAPSYTRPVPVPPRARCRPGDSFRSFRDRFTGWSYRIQDCEQMERDPESDRTNGFSELSERSRCARGNRLPARLPPYP